MTKWKVINCDQAIIGRHQHSIYIWRTFCRNYGVSCLYEHTIARPYAWIGAKISEIATIGVIFHVNSRASSTHSRNNTIQYMSGDTRMCECRGGTIEEQIRERSDYHCLPMYNSELFKTVWTKIGRMCSYIICAKSYLSG